MASVEAIRLQGPKRLVGAIPVGPRETIAKAKAVVDELIVLSTPEPFWSVGSHYAQFAQLDDREGSGILAFGRTILSQGPQTGACCPRLNEKRLTRHVTKKDASQSVRPALHDRTHLRSKP